MVRPADLRKRKYEGKVDPDTLAIQTRALKPLMVRGETLYFPAIATVEEKVKRLVEAEGTPTLQVRDYLNFGREMYELTRKFSGSTLRGEAQLRVNKWSERGLTGTLLIRVSSLFGVSLTAPPAPPEAPYHFFENIYTPAYFYSFLVSETDLPTREYSEIADIIMTTPFPFPRRVHLTKIGIWITNPSVGGLARLGIYASKEKTIPSNLIVDAGEVDCSVVRPVQLDVDVVLEKGLYHLAFLCNHDDIKIPEQSIFGMLLGIYMFMSANGGWAVSFPYGPLPDPYPTPTFPDDTSTGVPSLFTLIESMG